jgi:hypothetical protein
VSSLFNTLSSPKAPKNRKTVNKPKRWLKVPKIKMKENLVQPLVRDDGGFIFWSLALAFALRGK